MTAPVPNEAGGVPEDPARPAPHTDHGEEEPVVREVDAAESPAAADAAVPAGGDDGHVDLDPDVEAQRDEYLALAQRTQADFDNYRKRAARDVAAAGVRARAELVRAMLPVVDNLERALASAGEGEAGLAEGVRLVHSELVGALERSGVASIEPSGEPFDPNLHEALSTRPENGAEPGVVLDVVQKGYRLDQTVLRPARVVVAA